MSILNTAPEVAPRGASPLLLLDADYLAYMVGGISQSKDKDPSVTDQEYVCNDKDRDLWVWVDPIDLVHWRVDNEIEKIKDRFQTTSMEVWLTPDEGNFRYSVAVSRPYKGKRSSVRPVRYGTIRNYLLEVHGAQVADGCEADDMVCTRQMDCFRDGTRSVIVGPDKDLKCMFGAHYNPRKDIEEWITWEEAALNFYGQMITGDTVDNIPGCPGRGVVYWQKILNRCEHLTGWPLVETIADEVREAYRSKGMDFDYFNEQADLLHMRRRLNEEWYDDYHWSDGYVDQYYP